MDFINNAKLKRNFLFCLLTTIEIDLRNNLLYLINEGLKIGDDIHNKIKDRYFDETKNNSDEISILINYVDIGDYIQILNANSSIFSNKKQLKKIQEEIEKIIPVRNRVMHIRPLEFNDDEKLQEFVSNIENYKDIVDFPETKMEFEKIKSNPNYLISISFSSLPKYSTSIRHNLPMVDYDDTGFIGRNNDKKLLKNKILGAYPVISVIGVGGIGKTSLALSCLYDLIDEYQDKKDFFNTIIWISLKTKGLFDGNFKSIKDAIVTLDGNFKYADKSFDDIKVSNIDEILDYMKSNKTLLVIDNLETLSNDKNIKDLFENIPAGSKILITSRIGIGNYEHTFPLDKLSDNDALLYFRKLCNIYKIGSLIGQPDSLVLDYLKRLNNNPLAIKWFIINVGKGMTPDNIFNSKFDNLTDFCLSNIYEKLSDNAKYILRIILRKYNICNIAELLYLCELNYDDCMNAVNELFKSNFLKQNEDFSYSILDFAVNYIQSQKGFSNYEVDNKIQTNINKLNGSLENLKKDIHLTNKYHPLSLFPIKNDENIATLYMLKAIEVSKQKNYNLLDEYYGLAINASRNFSDIYKIAGYLYSKFDVIKSEENYKIALELTEDKAPIHYFYAGALINNQKYELAELELSEALKLDPSNSLIILRMARLFKMQNKYEESLELLKKIDPKEFSLNKNRMEVKYIFEMIDTRIRYAESLLRNNNDKALIIINEAINFINNNDIKIFDFTIYNSLFKLSHIYIKLLYITNFEISNFINYLYKYHPYILAAKKGHKKEKDFDSDVSKLCNKIDDNDSKKINDIINYKASIKELNYGYISSIKENGYGFITPTTYSYQTLFFHCSQFKGDFRKLNVSDRVSFELVIDENINAVNVTLAPPEIGEQENESIFSEVV